jgi:TrmH RNA methyltransferase
MATRRGAILFQRPSAVRADRPSCHDGPRVPAPTRKPPFGPTRAAERTPPPVREASELVQGLRAGLAVFARRPDDILRVLHARTVRQEVTELARWAARQSVPCAEAPEGELDRFAESTHHEGLCVVTRPRRWSTARELADALARTRGAVVALDRVRNPYNVGAILRSAAFFGLEGALFGAQAPHPELASTAVRVAEGAVEHLTLSRTTDLADTLARMRQRGVRVVGADGHANTRAIGFAFGRPVVLVLGNEREGLGDRVRAQCDAIVAVGGTGRVESLNVAVAAGVLMAELVRPAAAPPRA